MSIRALDGNSDWTCGQGVQDYLVGNDEIAEDCQTALKTFLGECFFATDFGIDWWNLLGSRNEAAIILQCRTMIASRPGVQRINSVTSSLNRTTRRLTVTFDIQTIYGQNLVRSITTP